MVPTQKSSGLFVCECCNYSSSRKSQYYRHLSTDKHKILQNPTSKKFQTEKLHICDCGKKYKHSSTLFAHKKQCIAKNIENATDNTKLCELDKDELIIQLLKQNKELIEVLKNGTNNNNNTNSHNKTFNLQFFLNETCKGAMNIMDFVDSIKLQLSDLERVGEIGYVEGISNIIVKNLNDLDITERPIHCTDKKRETIYIKDEDKWEKEDEGKMKIRKVIKKVASKNSLLIPKFKEVHPDCIKSVSPFSDQYNKLIIESMGGPGDNDVEKENKIIRNISKNIIIDK